MSKNIRCIGGAAIDRKLKPLHPLQLASSNRVSSVTTFGGVAYNVAKNLSRLTDHIHLQCVVGDDAAGQQILAHLQASGIKGEASLILANQTTAQYYAVLESQGELHIALADMGIYDQIPFETFTSAWQEWQHDDIVFVDTNLPSPLIEYAIALSRRNDLTLCIDPVSVIKAERLPAILAGVFLLKPDRLEAEILTGMPIRSIKDCIAAGIALLKKGVKNSVISLGSLGYVVVNESVQQHFSAYSVERVTDVSGAGDAFIAGILFELKQGSAILPACELGAAAAAITLQSDQTVVDEMSLPQLKTQLAKQKLGESLNHATVL